MRERLTPLYEPARAHFGAHENAVVYVSKPAVLSEGDWFLSALLGKLKFALGQIPRRETGSSLMSDMACGMSLANLCFIANWIPILTLGDPKVVYYRMTPPDFGLLFTLLVDIVSLGMLLFLFLRFQASSSPSKRCAGFILFLAVSAIALNELRALVLAELPNSYAKFLWTAFFPAFAVASILRPYRARRAWSAFLIITSPLFPILAANGTWFYSRAGLSLADDPHASMLAPVRPNRAIWIIFDELDERLAFDARPERVRMPEFDRLRRESLFAGEALPPAPETLRSLPSLITGRTVVDARRTEDDLQLRFAGVQDTTAWSKTTNIFRRAHAAGFNTALSGWFHPYCRVIGQDLCACAWDNAEGVTRALVVEDFLKSKSLFEKSAYLASWRQINMPIIRSLERERHIEEERLIYRSAARMLRNRDLNLVLIHLPIPHRPGIWNEREKAFTTKDANYLDNMILTDRVLGEIRRTMEASGDWQRSAILVSSDHPFRVDMWRKTPYWNPEMERVTAGKQSPYIPFLLKLPGQREGLVYGRKFNTILSSDLLLDVLNGRLKTASEASAWLDSRAAQSMIDPEGPIRPLQ